MMARNNLGGNVAASGKSVKEQDVKVTKWLTVKVQGLGNSIEEFRMKQHSSLAKLMNTYCESQGLAIAETRFLCDGKRISQVDTPLSMEMEDGDTIEVFTSFYGNGQMKMNMNANEEVRSDKKEQESKWVTVKVQGLDNSSEDFRMKQHSSLGKLMKTYCESRRLAIDDVRFLYDGENISKVDTPLSMKMEDGDTIQVYYIYHYGNSVRKMEVNVTATIDLEASDNNEQGSTSINLKVRGTTNKEHGSTSINLDVQSDDDKQGTWMNLKVLGLDNSVAQFKIKKHAPLGKLMNTYCKRAGLSKKFIRFLFDGERVNDIYTPLCMGMEEGDTIELHTEQESGYGGSFKTIDS